METKQRTERRKAGKNKFGVEGGQHKCCRKGTSSDVAAQQIGEKEQMKPSEVTGAPETRGGGGRFSQHLKSTATPPNHLHVAPLKHTELGCLLEWTWTTGTNGLTG